MKRACIWILAGALGWGLGSSTSAQNAAGNYEDLMKLLPAETFLWVATKDLEKGFREIAPHLGENQDRHLIHLLPPRAQDSNHTNFIAALTAMGVKTDGTAAIGMLILPDKNGRTRMDDNMMVVVLPIGRQDALEAMIQAEARDNPPRQNLGGITVVGSESDRFNCAWTDKYFVFGARPCVALVVETFLGKHRAVAKAPPGDGLFLVHFNPGQFSGVFTNELRRKIESRNPDNAGSLPPAAQQSLEIMEACEGFTIFADLAGNRLTFKGRLGLQNTPALARLLSAEPEQLALLQCLPADAPLVAATSLTPELLSIWAGFMGSFLDRETQMIAVFSQLTRPMAGRQIALAFTRGSFGSALPNILCAADCRDPEAAQAGFEALSSLCVAKERKPFTVAQVGGTEIRTFKAGSDYAMAAARSEKRLFFATDSDAIRKAVGQPVQSGSSVSDIPEIADLLGPEKKSSLLVFADFPRIFSSMDEARRDRMVKSQQQSCVYNMQEAERMANLYQEKLGRAPTDLPGMLPALAEVGVKNPRLQTNCVSDAKAPLALDPATRKVTCPHHGTVSQPLAYVPPDLLARPRRDAFQGLEILGRGAIRLNVSPNGFDIEGKLNLNPPKPPDPIYTCINNLRQVDAAKEQWALEYAKRNGDQPEILGVNQYIKGNKTPVCPAGGKYTYNPLGIKPECSVPGHQLH